MSCRSKEAIFKLDLAHFWVIKAHIYNLGQNGKDMVSYWANQ
jgi:hypothetical protein